MYGGVNWSLTLEAVGPNSIRSAHPQGGGVNLKKTAGWSGVVLADSDQLRTLQCQG